VGEAVGLVAGLVVLIGIAFDIVPRVCGG